MSAGLLSIAPIGTEFRNMPNQFVESAGAKGVVAVWPVDCDPRQAVVDLVGDIGELGHVVASPLKPEPCRELWSDHITKRAWRSGIGYPSGVRHTAAKSRRIRPNSPSCASEHVRSRSPPHDTGTVMCDGTSVAAGDVARDIVPLLFRQAIITGVRPLSVVSCRRPAVSGHCSSSGRTTCP